MKRLTAEQKALLAQNMRHIEELYEQCFIICNGKIPHNQWAPIRTAHHYAKRANFKLIRFKTSDLSASAEQRMGLVLEEQLSAVRKHYSDIRYAAQNVVEVEDGTSI